MIAALNSDNLIFFYLTGAILALTFAVIAYIATRNRSDHNR